MFKKKFPSRILHLIIITFLITFFLSKSTNAQYDISVKINETEINNVLNALVEARGINFGDYTGNFGLAAWYVNVDAASVNIQPNNVITLNVNLALAVDLNISIFSQTLEDHQQLSVTGHFEIEGNLQTGYNLVFVHDPISVSFFGVVVNNFPDNIKINLGSSILPESISTLFTSGIPQINTNDNEIIFGFNFQGPRFFIFKNNFMDVSNGGIINIDGSQYYSPTSVEVNSGNSVTATAIDQTILGISYVFTSWSNGSTSRTTIFSQEGTYTANFSDNLSHPNRNLHFINQNMQPITLLWNEHPNTTVTQYQIWRKVNYNKQGASSPVLIGTVNRGTTSFVDQDFMGTRFGFTDWMLYYDVKSYYSIGQTYSDDDYVMVFSGGLIPEARVFKEEIIVIKENSLNNFPNPFNPSTIIRYQIVKAGHVTLKVYDTLGREVANLVDKQQPSGKYSVNFNASNLSSGIYLYKITANGFTAVKKMVLTK